MNESLRRILNQLRYTKRNFCIVLSSLDQLLRAVNDTLQPYSNLHNSYKFYKESAFYFFPFESKPNYNINNLADMHVIIANA